jgi:hypothetical protein
MFDDQMGPLMIMTTNRIIVLCFAIILLLPLAEPFLVTKLPKSAVDSALHALTPVGPFCPFRSAAALEMEPQMEQLNAEYWRQYDAMDGSTILDELMRTGQISDPDKLRKFAENTNSATDRWESVVTRLRLSQDFQTREYAKLMQAKMADMNITFEGLAAYMRWQADLMLAFADNKPPPMPPSNDDIEQIMRQVERKAVALNDMPSMSMAAPLLITENPFEGIEDVFQSEAVKEEYQKLCRDHTALIDFGSKYESFDPLGKCAYLDEIDKIHERWDVFFARQSLLGALNKKFLAQCNAFLDSLGLDEEQYRNLLKKAHDIMRQDAEEERSRLGL